MHLIHRGIVNKKYKENLLKSFKKSFNKGYGIETDIHATKDKEFVCFHDFPFIQYAGIPPTGILATGILATGY